MARPKKKTEYLRDNRILVSYSPSEIERLYAIVDSHNCESRVDLIRRASLGEITIDLKKIKEKKRKK
jgi:hypothetical protein